MDSRSEKEKGNHSDSMNNNASNTPLDWRFGDRNLANAPTGLVSGDNPMSVRSSPFGHNSLWDNPTNPKNMGFCEDDMQKNAVSLSRIRKNGSVSLPSNMDRLLDTTWHPPSSSMKADIFMSNAAEMPPHGFTQFPTDSGFIERAARFSCFSGGSCYSDMVNPFSVPDSMGLYSRATQDVFAGNGLKSLTGGGSSQKNELRINQPSRDGYLLVDNDGTERSPSKNDRICESVARSFEETKQGIPVLSGNESGEAEFSGRDGGGGRDDPSGLEATGMETLGQGPNLKKRKRLVQDGERDQSKGTRHGDALKDDSVNQQNSDQSPNSIPNKTTGKQLPQASDHSKEGYIHVRARRGQATNSHSLAERVRREKISERMKFLQDLVPGCSKVTGKAVMLDEIINYVQSLQRQVEFLSMKLATVNPRLDFDIEGLLAKDILQSRLGTSSSTLGFPPDVPMTYPLHPSALAPSTLPGIGSPSDLLLRTISSQMPDMSRSMSGGFKEPTQLPNASWEDELHNVVHMSYGGGVPPENQDATGTTQ